MGMRVWALRAALAMKTAVRAVAPASATDRPCRVSEGGSDWREACSKLPATDGTAHCLTGLEAVDMRSWAASVAKGRCVVLGRSWTTASVEHRFLAATWLPAVRSK